jgi:hypothetical protein
MAAAPLTQRVKPANESTEARPRPICWSACRTVCDERSPEWRVLSQRAVTRLAACIEADIPVAVGAMTALLESEDPMKLPPHERAFLCSLVTDAWGTDFFATDQNMFELCSAFVDGVAFAVAMLHVHTPRALSDMLADYRPEERLVERHQLMTATKRIHDAPASRSVTRNASLDAMRICCHLLKLLTAHAK